MRDATKQATRVVGLVLGLLSVLGWIALQASATPQVSTPHDAVLSQPLGSPEGLSGLDALATPGMPVSHTTTPAYPQAAPVPVQEARAHVPLGVEVNQEQTDGHETPLPPASGADVFIGTMVAPGAPDSKGTDFWLTFPGNAFCCGTPTLSLFITGDTDTTGTVTIPGLGFSTPFSVTAGRVTTVGIPLGAHLTTSDVVENKGIHVTALAEVTVYGLNRIQATTDAYLGLPTDILGTEYIVLGYKNSNVVNATEFALVGTAGGTTVTITPSVTTGPRPGGVPYTITLNQGQTYQLINTNSAPADLSGTLVTSDKPIAVFGGHNCANIPPGFVACDHIVEQLPPTVTWGKNFVTMPLATRKNGDTFRFLASMDGTTVSVNGVVVATLNRRQLHERIITGPAQITSNQPILVAQYSHGTSFDGVTSDPFMMLIPPFEQFLGSYTVTTPTSGFPINFINIVTPNAAVGAITLDGAAIPASSFIAIGSSGFSGAQVSVSLGSHNLSGPLPFGAFVYGFGSFDSYGYPGGLSLAPVAVVTHVALTPKTATNPVGTQHCVVATVTDQNDKPVVGVRTDFNVTGVNPTAGFANTGNNGQAQFCYTGANPGTDSIVASVGTISDTATKTWTAGADLSLTKTDSPDPVQVEQHLTYTATVTNKGPDTATGVVVSDTLPAGVTFVSAAASQGNCSGTSTVTCTLGTITNTATATVTIVVTPTAPGTITNTAKVSSDVSDPVPGNNTATASTTVWSLVFRQGTTALGVNPTTGDFALTYLVDGVPQTCSGAGARVDDGLLTISSRCTGVGEDSRDTIRAVGPINATLTIELIDQTGPGARDRVVRRFLTRGQLTCVQPPEGLVAWWPGDGDAKDIVGTNHGTLQNGATFAAGLVGQAFSFDGVDDYVAVADSPNLDGMAQLTVDAWVKFNALPSGKWQWIVSKAAVVGSGSNSYSIWLAGDTMKITAAIENSAGDLITVQAPDVFADTTSFHHVAITYDGSSLKLFIDGALKNSATFSGTIRDTTFPFFIGRRSGAGIDGRGDTLNGLVDEVEIYNRALTAGEIQGIFNAGSAGKCKTIRVLGIDTTSSWAYTIVPFLSRITFTKVSPADFATVNLNNFDVLLVSETFLDTNVTVPAQATLDALKARETELANWISAGHGVVTLSEPIGIGRFAWLPAIVRPTVEAAIHADTVHIVNSAHPVMAGLTDADLSGWGASSHGNFTSTGGLDVLVTDGSTRPITLASTFGRGKIVITDQDPDFHHHLGTVKPAQVRLVQNAINWAASPAPGVAALALTGCTTCRPGDQLTLEARVTPGPAPVTADVYVALQLPDQTLLFMQADGGFTRESRPLVIGWTVVPFRGEIFRHTFNGGEPSGRYTWLLAFTEPGTSRIMGGIGAIAQAAFTFSP